MVAHQHVVEQRQFEAAARRREASEEVDAILVNDEEVPDVAAVRAEVVDTLVERAWFPRHAIESTDPGQRSGFHGNGFTNSAHLAFDTHGVRHQEWGCGFTK